MGDLFDQEADRKRRRLRQRGWSPAGRTYFGVPCWRHPDGAPIVEEPEAFRRLEDAEISEQDRED